jgi:PAS domain S-box-containing protein
LNTTIRILLVEDNPGDALLIRKMIAANAAMYVLDHVTTLAACCELLRSDRHDVILLDLGLPDSSGIATLERLIESFDSTAIIILTGLDDDKLALQAVSKGAQDFLVKNFLDSRLLIKSINYAIERRKIIDAKVKLEEKVYQANIEWQSTFDSISDSIALIDPEQKIIRCNKATRTLLGLEFTDILDQPCWKLFHGTDSPISDCPMSRARLSLYSETSTIQHLDRWMEDTVDPILSESGLLTGAVHIVRDVTERIKLVDSIKETNNLFSLFLKYSPVYSFIKEVTDTESRVLLATDNFSDMIGISGEQMVGKTMHELFPAEFAQKITADDQDVVSGGTVLQVDEELNGRQYTTIKFPITQGGRRLLAGYTIDISDRKRSEETLREMQSQLMQQDKLATIGQLAAGVAHEINNPMGFVGSNMVTLRKYVEKYNHYIDGLEQEIRSASSGGLPETVQALRRQLKMDYMTHDVNVLLDDNIEGIERVERIVHDLSTFSRASSSISDSADLNSCLDSTINILMNEIKYSAVLKREFGELPDVHCNAQQINQVFMNLLINALHAIQEKGEEIGEIVVRTWRNNGGVFISISDTGCGISPENMSKIFDAFYTTKEIGKGTGLGLAISAGIVLKHGGEITVKSEVGVGSTFTVRLPINGTAGSTAS